MRGVSRVSDVRAERARSSGASSCILLLLEKRRDNGMVSTIDLLVTASVACSEELSNRMNDMYTFAA